VRKLLERTLQIDRRQRLQAIGEARIALENQPAIDPGSSGLKAGETVPARSGRLWTVAGALALALIVAGLFKASGLQKVIHVTFVESVEEALQRLSQAGDNPV
jgi:hypothetical protein